MTTLTRRELADNACRNGYAAYAKAVADYRSRKIGDDEYLAARKTYLKPMEREMTLFTESQARKLAKTDPDYFPKRTRFTEWMVWSAKADHFVEFDTETVMQFLASQS